MVAQRCAPDVARNGRPPRLHDRDETTAVRVRAIIAVLPRDRAADQRQPKEVQA